MDRSQLLHVDLGKELARLVDQRAKQQGISRSEYIREAIILELFFSGDLEAMKFVAKRVGNRVKAVMAEKIAGVDLQRQVGELLSEQA